MQKRLLYASGISLVATIVSALTRPQPGNAGDFLWVWIGANLLAQQVNPYQVTAPYPFEWPLYYPAPALVAIFPLLFLPAVGAGLLFICISTFFLAFGIYTEAHRHRWPLFLSAPFVVSLTLMQWTPLITAIYVFPALAAFALCKPTIGLPALVVTRPKTWGVILLLLLFVASLIILPSWPLDWLRNVPRHENGVPLLSISGAALVVSLLYIGLREGRILFSLGLMPQRGYDPLGLWLIPRTTRGVLYLSLCSWPGYIFWYLTRDINWVVIGMYLPALLMLMVDNKQQLRQYWRRVCSAIIKFTGR